MSEGRVAMEGSLLISGREAARELAEVGLTRRQSCRVLACGLAGVPVVTRGASLYDADRVRELADRPALSDESADAATPGGLFVARRDVDVLTPELGQRESLRAAWGFSWRAAVTLRILAEQHGQVPLVATVGGFVVLGADIVTVRGSADGFDLVLQEPGPWFSTFRDRRFGTGPGRAWVLRDRLVPTPGTRARVGRVGQSAP